MAWDVNLIYGYLKWQIRKNQSGGITATDFFYAWNAEQYAYHDNLIGPWQKNNNTKEGINTGIIQNEVVMSKMAPFIINYTGAISSGIANKPADYIYGLALRINGKRVTAINHDQVFAVNEDVIDPPSIAENCYYYVEYANGGVPYFSFLPNAVTSFELDYIAVCADVVWGWTLDANGRQVYNVATSVQPKWNQNTIVEITRRTLKSLGVSYKDSDFVQYGQSIIQTAD